MDYDNKSQQGCRVQEPPDEKKIQQHYKYKIKGKQKLLIKVQK